MEPTSDSGTYIVVFRRKRFLIVRSCIKVQHRAMSQAASVRRRDRHVVGRARFAARARGAPPAELHHQRAQRRQASGAVPAGDGVGPQHLAMMQRQGRVLFPPPPQLEMCWRIDHVSSGVLPTQQEMGGSARRSACTNSAHAISTPRQSSLGTAVPHANLMPFLAAGVQSSKLVSNFLFFSQKQRKKRLGLLFAVAAANTAPRQATARL